MGRRLPFSLPTYATLPYREMVSTSSLTWCVSALNNTEQMRAPGPEGPPSPWNGGWSSWTRSRSCQRGPHDRRHLEKTSSPRHPGPGPLLVINIRNLSCPVSSVPKNNYTGHSYFSDVFVVMMEKVGEKRKMKHMVTFTHASVQTGALFSSRQIQVVH